MDERKIFWLFVIGILVLLFIYPFVNLNTLGEEIADECSGLATSAQISACKLRNKQCSDDSCYLEKAKTFSNETLCFEIEDETLRIGCSTVVAEAKITKRSVLEDNIELCNEFENENRSQRCIDNYYIAKVKNGADKSFCANIQNEVVRNECNK